MALLSIQDLEKIAIQFEDQIKEILIGEKSDCCRRKVFLRGHVKNILEHRNQPKLQLNGLVGLKLIQLE